MTRLEISMKFNDHLDCSLRAPPSTRTTTCKLTGWYAAHYCCSLVGCCQQPKLLYLVPPTYTSLLHLCSEAPSTRIKFISAMEISKLRISSILLCHVSCLNEYSIASHPRPSCRLLLLRGPSAYGYSFMQEMLQLKVLELSFTLVQLIRMFSSKFR